MQQYKKLLLCEIGSRIHLYKTYTWVERFRLTISVGTSVGLLEGEWLGDLEGCNGIKVVVV